MVGLYEGELAVGQRPLVVRSRWQTLTLKLGLVGEELALHDLRSWMLKQWHHPIYRFTCVT